jgi:ABC-type Fe3+-hydroxamate transport system substrate-binding protein
MPVYEAAGSPGELPLWRRVPPVVADRVHEVPAAWITAVSHHAARGLARLARVLHPQRFS